jgi:hypothetical protein
MLTGWFQEARPRMLAAGKLAGKVAVVTASTEGIGC